MGAYVCDAQQLTISAGLASFTGMLFRRYSADLTPLLTYIVHQLHNGQTTEIVVFREVIWKMAGIQPLPSLSDSQIAAMAGGPTLRIEAVASSTRGARLDPADAILKGPQRLGRALLDSSLALPLLIQVAQQRQACVFQAPDAYLKSLASLFDTVSEGCSFTFRCILTSVLDSRSALAISGVAHHSNRHHTRRLRHQGRSAARRSEREVRHRCTHVHADLSPYPQQDATGKCLPRLHAFQD